MSIGSEGSGNYADVIFNDTVNGEGFRTSLFVQGCSLRCKGCWNPSLQNPRLGSPLDDDILALIVESCSYSHVSGLSILGGEPFENLHVVRRVVKEFRRKYGHSKTIWVWSGYTFDDLKENPETLNVLKDVDILVDGPYMQEERDLSLHFRGSRNQRIIDVSSSFDKGVVTCYHC